MFKSVLRTSSPLIRSSTLSIRSTIPSFTAKFSTSRVVFNSISHKVNQQSHLYKYLTEGPVSVKYTAEHEWLATFSDDTAFVGITKYASEALGDVTFVELPEIGDQVEVGDTIGSVESVKSASEIYSPIAGEVIAINENLESDPSLINSDPIGNGWIAQIKLANVEDVEASEELLTEEQYEASLEHE
ncbi:H-protein subunit of glycine cleavage system [Scheffersomyces coipomensis]|uniref:H-protein subunit of glycine cleavage system n=1 Tax=Scheffersomyces coipomensis TaxID=1788519 RepID=UPI00315C771D